MPLYFVSFRAMLSPALVFFFFLSGLGHRQISPSLSALCVRTVIRHIPSSVFVSRFTRPQTPEVCPECAQCGCSPCGAGRDTTCGAVSILSISRGCYPRLRPFPAILFGLCSFCRIVSGVSDYVPDKELQLRLYFIFSVSARTSMCAFYFLLFTFGAVSGFVY